ILISSRRTGRIPSDVQKRRLPPGAAAGPEPLRGQNQAGRPAEPTRTPMKTDLNPHGTVNGRGAAYCKRIASLCTGPGAGVREGPRASIPGDRVEVRVQDHPADPGGDRLA